MIKRDLLRPRPPRYAPPPTWLLSDNASVLFLLIFSEGLSKIFWREANSSEKLTVNTRSRADTLCQVERE